MAEDDIVTRIILEGADEINRVLESVAKSGTLSFEQIEKAAEKAGKTLDNFARVARTVQTAFNGTAQVARNVVAAVSQTATAYQGLERATVGAVRQTTILTASLAGTATGLVALATSAINAADRIQDTAAGLGLSVQRFQELQAAFGDVGVSGRQFEQTFARFQQQVEANAKAGAKALLEFVDATKQKPHPNIRDVEPITRNFQQVIEGARRMQAVLSERNLPQRPFALVVEELSRLANGTDDTRHKFEQLTGIELPNASAGLQRLREQADGGKTALEKLGVQVEFNADGTINLDKALNDTADAFQRMVDPVKRTSIGIQLFGRQAGPKLVGLLKEGSAGLATFIETARRSSVFLENFGGADEGAKALDRLKFSADNTRIALGLVFAPSIIAAADGLTAILKDNQSSFQQFAQSIQNQVLPYVQAFFRILKDGDKAAGSSGNEAIDNATKNLLRLRDIAIQTGKAVETAFTKVILPAIKTVIAALDLVAQAFNAVFGTELSGEALAVVLILARLTGAFGVLTAAARLFGTVVVGLASVFGWIPVVVGLLGGIAFQFEAVQRRAQAFADVLNRIFGTNITGGEAFTGFLAAVAAGLLLVMRRAGLAGRALSLLARHPLAAALLLATGAAVGLTRSLDDTGDSAEKSANSLEDTGKAAEKTAKATNDAAKATVNVNGEMVKVAKEGAASFGQVTDAAETTKGAVAGLRDEVKKPIEIVTTTDPAKLQRAVTANREALKSSNDAVVAAMFQADEALLNGAEATIAKLGSVWREFFSSTAENLRKLGSAPLLSDTGDVAPQTQTPLTQESVSANDKIIQSAKRVREEFDLAIATANEFAGALNNAAVPAANEFAADIDVASATGNEFHREMAKVISISTDFGTAFRKGGIAVRDVSKEMTLAQGEQFKILSNGKILIDQATAAQIGLKDATQQTATTFQGATLASQLLLTEVRGSATAFRDAQTGAVLFRDAAVGLTTTVNQVPTAFQQVTQSAQQTTQAAQNVDATFDQTRTSATQFSASLQKANQTSQRTPQSLTTLTEAFASLAPQVEAANAALATFGQGIDFTALLSSIQTAVAEMMAAIVNAVSQAESQVEQAASRMVAAMQRVIEAAAAAAAAAASGSGSSSSSDGGDGSGGEGAEGFARGGRVWGPGTGTSDSILARLSAGEYVQPANVVRQPGVLSFLELLRRSGGDIDSALRGFRGFAVGGLVDSINDSMRISPPRFALGGLVPGNAGAGSTESFSLTFGGQTFRGLRAPTAVADHMRRTATFAQISSAGRAPR